MYSECLRYLLGTSDVDGNSGLGGTVRVGFL